ncbi:MAG: hypothetical protein A2Y25_05245 [Candidatus Melainabacteria bacterium GWF2_37_15]|nr:MAG: hypothetical protein A2Y25_05245 [Candidatus Melainabacteria bacterium GWF2_37_15]
MNHKLLFDPLVAILKKQKRSQVDIDKVHRAFDFACELHEGQYRASEEPYILHPIEVAKILADLQADTDTICAALLHDILEDTDTKPAQISEKFGEDVLTLVNGVTKLSKYSYSSREERQAENFRKMFLAMADDIRIIFLKLADRLHNMRTLNYMKLEKQKEIAKETLEIFVPLANRLGMGLIKSELEDLSLRYIHPEKYFEIAQLVAQAKAERDHVVQAIIEKVDSSLKNMHIKAVITGRAKTYYSIYAKMQRQQKTYQDLYDVTAIRVIVNTEKECYEVLGLIHSAFKPIPGRFKDYIAMPKNNLYRSLHTSVIGPRGKPLEVQIRTQEMHEVAEYGLAAHWKYKESGKSSKASQEELKFTWLRKLIEIQQDIKDAKEFVDSVKLDLFSDQVFVFTPKGDVIDLPADATPLDFAYRIHTEIGHRCIGAMINGRIVPLDTKLNNGDFVEVLTGKHERPRLDWINLVVTNQARSRIRLWFKKNSREEHITQGRQNLEHELTKAHVDELMKEGKILEISKQLNYQAEEDLFAALGYGEISITKITNRLRVEKLVNEVTISRKPQPKKTNRVIEGLEGMLYHISKCCSPVPGEPIIGVVTRSRGVSVHREDCLSLKVVDGERLLPISWNSDNIKRAYVTRIFVEVIDRLGVFKDVIGKISDSNINITEAKIKKKNKNFATVEVGIEIQDIDQLNKIIAGINTVSDVVSIKRR